MRRARRLLVAAATAATSSSPTAGTAGSANPTAGAVPRPDHVLVVVFENENADSVLGSSSVPYLTSLASTGMSFTDAHGERHPSQPNYLAMFSGSTQGLTDDSCPHAFTTPNLAGQLLDAGRSFVGYSEGLPTGNASSCGSGDYARKHVPWANFPALPASVNQPYSALPQDFADLPTVSFVIPDLCHDMHDCGLAAGDDWARTHLAGYAAWARTHNSLLVVTFDEDRGTAGNHIATFLVGPMVTTGTSHQRIDHYSLLRMMEDMYGLPALGKAADASPLTGIWAPS